MLCVDICIETTHFYTRKKEESYFDLNQGRENTLVIDFRVGVDSSSGVIWRNSLVRRQEYAHLGKCRTLFFF